jgi:hypothetical protein
MICFNAYDTVYFLTRAIRGIPNDERKRIPGSSKYDRSEHQETQRRPKKNIPLL